MEASFAVDGQYGKELTTMRCLPFAQGNPHAKLWIAEAVKLGLRQDEAEAQFIARLQQRVRHLRHTMRRGGVGQPVEGRNSDGKLNGTRAGDAPTSRHRAAALLPLLYCRCGASQLLTYTPCLHRRPRAWPQRGENDSPQVRH